MIRVRLLAVFGVGIACFLLVPRPQREEPATIPAVAEPEPPPFAFIARFGETRLRHPSLVQSLAFTRDNKTLVTTATKDRILRFWGVASGLLLRELPVQPADTATLPLVGFSASGHKLLATRHTSGSEIFLGSECEWGIVDVDSGEFRRCGDRIRYTSQLAISPDGTTIAALDYYAGETTTLLWDFQSGQRIRSLGQTDYRDEHRHSIAFSPDGKHVVVSPGSKPAVFIASTDGSGPMRRIPVKESPRGITNVFWPRADRIVAANSDSLMTLDTITGRELAHATHSSDRRDERRFYSQPVGNTVFVSREYDMSITVFDLNTFEKRPDRTFSGRSAILSHDGKVLALAHGSAVQLIDFATGGSLHPDLDRYPFSPANHLRFTDDGRRMLSLGWGDAQTWDMPDGRLRPAMKPSRFTALSFVGQRLGGRHPINGHDRMLMDNAETGKRDEKGQVWMWDEATSDFTAEALPGGQAGRTIPAPQGTAYTLASPDGRWLAASGWTGLQIRDTTANTEWVTLEMTPPEFQHPRCAFDLPICAIPVQFSPDGRFLLTQSDVTEGLQLWNIVGQPFRVSQLRYVHLHPWPSHAATFSRDGRRWAAVVAETDGKGFGSDHIRVWETTSGTEIFRFDPRNASGCAFTPDGKRMVVAHTDTTFSVWDYPALESRGVRADAKGALGRLATIR